MSNNETSIIYIVTEGAYSDYCIDAVFSTKAGAEDFIKRAERLYDPRIEEWGCAKDLSMLDDKNIYAVHMQRDGLDRVVHLHKNPNYISSAILEEISFSGRPRTVYFMILASTEEEAIQKAEEKRLEHIAAGTWSSCWDDC